MKEGGGALWAEGVRGLFRRLMPVCRKEFLHVTRDRGTLFFALLIPILQLFLFGFAVDTNVRRVPTAVLDDLHTQESRDLIARFAASDVFAVRGSVQSPGELDDAIRPGRARVGIRIPSTTRGGSKMGQRRVCWWTTRIRRSRARR